MSSQYGLLVCAQYRDWPGRYYPAALRAMAQLNDNYRPELIPIPADGQALGPLAFHEARLQLERGSYVVGCTASSSQAAGFTVQLRFGNMSIASARLGHLNISGGPNPSPEGLLNPLFLLPKPAIITAPGELTVQLWNLANAANTIQLVVFLAVPKISPAEPGGRP
jgi:hypothetical protein